MNADSWKIKYTLKKFDLIFICNKMISLLKLFDNTRIMNVTDINYLFKIANNIVVHQKNCVYITACFSTLYFLNKTNFINFCKLWRRQSALEYF